MTRPPLAPLILLLVILHTASVRAAHDCSSFVEKLETAFNDTNPTLLEWDISLFTCTDSQRYEANYIQAKAAFYMEQYARAQVQFERALVIGGARDDEILFFLQEVAKSSKDKKAATQYADILQDKFPESHFSSDAGSSEKPWEIIVTSKSKLVLTNDTVHVEDTVKDTFTVKDTTLSDLLLENKVAFQLTQSKGDLLFKESIGFGLKIDREDTTLHSFQSFAEGLLLYKNLLFTAGVTLDYYEKTVVYDTTKDSLGIPILDTNSALQIKEDASNPHEWSWFALLNYDWPVRKRWEIGHALLFFSADSGYKILDLSQSHTVKLNKGHNVSASFSFEKDFITDERAILRDLRMLTPQLQWTFKSGKNRWKLVTSYQWGKEELDFSKDLGFIKGIVSESIINPNIVDLFMDNLTSQEYDKLQIGTKDNTFEAYLSYKREVNKHFSLAGRVGLGAEGAEDIDFSSILDIYNSDTVLKSSGLEWTPYFWGRLQLIFSL